MIAKLWGLIPAQYRITALLVILAVLAGIALSIWGYGEIKYAAGKTAGAATCRADQAETAVNAANKSGQNLERKTNETAKMSDDAVLDDLFQLGILRNDTDR